MRKKLLTEDVLAQIPRWRKVEGLGPDEIAARIGCTVGTLRVVCCHRGISLKRPRATAGNGEPPATHTSTRLDSIQLGLKLPRKIRSRLRARAAQYRLSELELATVLLQTVARDDLYRAILDDAG
jgi:hypothetical protein